jgi:peptide/nickel transport system permease protein
MHRYIISRLLLVIPTLVGAAALVFILMRMIPGDICLVRLGSGGTSFSAQALAACHAELGLDSPFGITISSMPTIHLLWLVITPDFYWPAVRGVLGFLQYLWGLARFDLGVSMWSGKPVVQEIATRFPVSLEVAVMATLIAISIAIPLGTISALKQNTWIDMLVRTISIAGIATPSFWLGIMSILLVLDVTQAISGHPWMPSIDYVPLWKDPIRNLSIVMLPAITVGYRYAAVSMRMTRSAMLEVLREDYIRTARAKGLLEKIIINRHALKNALLPVVTVIGIEFAFLIGGLVVTEQVFNLNGIGRLMVLSVQNQDYTLTQALVMLVVTIAVLTNLAVDLFYAWLDPRIRLS